MIDVVRGTIVPIKFNTHTAGVPKTLAGSPVLKVLVGSSTTGASTGVGAITVDTPVTGSHQGLITTTDLTVYIPGNPVVVYISTGTVDGDSVVGAIVGRFTIEMAADGRRYQGQAQGVAAQTITLDAGDTETAAGNFIRIFTATTGAQQWAQVVSLAASVATMDRAWPVALTGTVIYRSYPGTLALTAAEQAAAVLQAATETPIAANVESVHATALQGTGVPTSDPWEPV